MGVGEWTRQVQIGSVLTYTDAVESSFRQLFFVAYSLMKIVAIEQFAVVENCSQIMQSRLVCMSGLEVDVLVVNQRHWLSLTNRTLPN